MAIKQLASVQKESKMKVLSSQTKEVAMHGVSMLGVDDKYLGKPPRATMFPSKFHPDTRKHWDALFQDESFLSELKEIDDMIGKWQLSIRRFISRCSQNQVDPFAQHTESHETTALYRYLSSARGKICKFMDSIRLFEVVKFSDTVRKYVRRENNFEVFVSAKITGFGTLENLSAYLLKAGFRKSGDSFIYMVDGTAGIKVDVSKPSNVRLCYEIKVGSGFTHPKEGKVRLTNKHYDAYITRKIWLPIVRAIQFNSINRKTLF